jgi:hypothetical protein
MHSAHVRHVRHEHIGSHSYMATELLTPARVAVLRRQTLYARHLDVIYVTNWPEQDWVYRILVVAISYIGSYAYYPATFRVANPRPPRVNSHTL